MAFGSDSSTVRYVVEMRGIHKRFGPVLANDGIDFQLRRGEIHALLGENGAGKTTLARILYGLCRADAGEILVEGRPVSIDSPREAIRQGLGMVTQHFALVPSMSVAENVVLGCPGQFRLDRAGVRRRVSVAAVRLGLEVDVDARVGDLSVGQKQQVEILKALYRQVQVLILDEPTAALSPLEAGRLLDTLERLCRGGLAVVLISHKLKEILAVSDRVTVLRAGRVVGTVDREGMAPEQLAGMMVGRKIAGSGRADGQEPAYRMLQVKDLWVGGKHARPALKGIHLEVRAGEILGLVGVSGNGQKELLEVLCGLRRPRAGQVLLAGCEVSGSGPVELSAAGLGFLPEDRLEGVVGELSVAENLALGQLERFCRRGLLDQGALQRWAETLIRQYQIKADPGARADTLSGGNLQKLLLARVLSLRPRALVVPQPTRGLDVAAAAYVHDRLIRLRAEGAAILLISEDMDELLALSDRLAVIYEGEIVGQPGVHEADMAWLGLLMTGACPGTDRQG